MMTDGELTPPPPGGLSEKIFRRHRERLAIVYIRQSTVQQVERHQESTRLQYALVDRAFHLGWARESIVVVDDDLGRSGATIEGRLGFQRLVAEVGLGRVGLVLGVEMSRLARSNRLLVAGFQPGPAWCNVNGPSTMWSRHVDAAIQ